MAKIPAGGPATINGVLYQMLWTLLRTTSLRIADAKSDTDGEAVTEATLILEPSAGGDVRVDRPDALVVEQVKARPDGGSWSLKELVESVLPDLFRAVALARVRPTWYRFVTEGRMGGWDRVYEFFRSLRDRECPEHGILSSLDSVTKLPFRRSSRAPKGKTPYWAERHYTPCSLFEHIVQELLRHPPIAKVESEDTARRKLWHLLGRFEFLGGQTTKHLQDSVDRELLRRIDLREQVQEKREAMLTGLARLAIKGDTRVNTGTFRVCSNIAGFC